MRKATTMPLAVGVLVGLPGLAPAADVVIGVPSWSSAIATAHVLKVALERELDVSVRLQNGTSEAIFAGMEEGSIHVHPEVWLPNDEALSSEYVVRRKTVAMSPHGVPARQGLCVTRHTRERFGVAAVADLTDPEKAAVFDTSGNGRGEMWIGAPDWSSTRIERIRARSYGYDDTMQLLEGEETLAVAAVDVAVAADKPLAFYCYEPHYMFELHDVVYLDEPRHDPRRWTIKAPASGPDWLERSDAAVAWPVSFFHIHYAASLPEDRPDIAAFLSAVRLDVDTVSQMAYALVVKKRPPAEFAAEWVSANEERVSAWRRAAQRETGR